MNPVTLSLLEKETTEVSARLRQTFSNSVLSANELDALSISPREPLVGTWWMQGALGFLFGPRGLGKTWLAIHLARCIAEGRDCGPWKITKPHKVLYIDGEMALDALRQRDRALSHDKSAPLHFLSHEYHFSKTNCGLNLSALDAQNDISAYCRENQIEVLFLDNLSCLFSGMRENDADDWETVLPWLLNLRREGIAVCIVHHAGRSGANMRGTSRREDAAFWVMRLDAPNGAEDFPGARFVGRFTKYREGEESERGPWQWTFSTVGTQTTVHHSHMENLDLFLQIVRDGLESCSDIAVEMAVSKGTVSKWAKKAVESGRLHIENGRYRSIES